MNVHTFVISAQNRPNDATMPSDDLEDSMAKMGRPISLPGIWGPMAASVGGVQALATRLMVGERSLRNWATNVRSMDSIAAGKVWDLLEDLPEIQPTLYQLDQPLFVPVASIPDGWVTWPTVRDGWDLRTAWKGDPTTLILAPSGKAYPSGWPW